MASSSSRKIRQIKPPMTTGHRFDRFLSAAPRLSDERAGVTVGTRPSVPHPGPATRPTPVRPAARDPPGGTSRRPPVPGRPPDHRASRAQTTGSGRARRPTSNQPSHRPSPACRGWPFTSGPPAALPTPPRAGRAGRGPRRPEDAAAAARRWQCRRRECQTPERRIPATAEAVANQPSRWRPAGPIKPHPPANQ